MPLTPEQQALADNANLPAGTAGSPWSLPYTPPAVPAVPTPPVVASPSATNGITRYTDPVATEMNALDRTAPTADEEAAIRENARKALQSQIDATNAYYADLVTRENQAGEGRLGSNRAIQGRSGLMGSDFGATQTENVESLNAASVKAIENERNLKVSEIMGRVDANAKAEIVAQKQEALGNANAYINWLSKTQDTARTDLMALAKTGADLTKMNPDQKTAWMKQTGYDELTFDNIYNAYKPAAEKIKYTYDIRKDGSIVRYGDNGEFKVFSDTKLPPEVDPQFINTDNGHILYVDKNNPTNPDGTVKYQDMGNYAKPVVKETTKYTKSYNETGGLAFAADDQPVTISKYMQAKSVSLSNALSGSKDPGDLQLLAFINRAVKSGDAELQNLVADAQTAIYNGTDIPTVLEILKQNGALKKASKFQ